MYMLGRRNIKLLMIHCYENSIYGVLKKEVKQTVVPFIYT